MSLEVVMQVPGSDNVGPRNYILMSEGKESLLEKNDRTATVVRASPICSAPCVLHQCTVVFA